MFKTDNFSKTALYYMVLNEYAHKTFGRRRIKYEILKGTVAIS